MPSNWFPYFASDDADVTAEAVRSAGGTVTVEPVDVMDQCRMIFAADPSGRGPARAGFMVDHLK
jgi:uncharacterized protein